MTREQIISEMRKIELFFANAEEPNNWREEDYYNQLSYRYEELENLLNQYDD